jgi:DNA-binding transcriptional ArsR family regulator
VKAATARERSHCLMCVPPEVPVLPCRTGEGDAARPWLRYIIGAVKKVQDFYCPSMKSRYTVTDIRQIRAMASPGRDEILDAVAAISPCTVPELARFLGRSRHSLYYHVRALRDCGLLVEVDKGQSGSGARYRHVGNIWIRYDLADPRKTNAIIALSAARLRYAQRGFARACRDGKATVEGPRRNLWVARWKGWMSDEDLAEANLHLDRLIALMKHGRHHGTAKTRMHELTFVISPTPENNGRPKRRKPRRSG